MRKIGRARVQWLLWKTMLVLSDGLGKTPSTTPHLATSEGVGCERGLRVSCSPQGSGVVVFRRRFLSTLVCGSGTEWAGTSET